MVKSRCAEPQRPGFKPGSARWGEGKGLQFLPQGVHSSEGEGARETERNTERSKGTDARRHQRSVLHRTAVVRDGLPEKVTFA